jgi:tetratricopeptide (TPR) repeat protein
MANFEITEQNKVNEQIDSALKLQYEGRLLEAQEIYLKILEKEPNFYAYHQMGVIAYDIQNYNMAVAYANLAMKSNPSSALPVITIGLVFLKQKQFDKAEICFRQSVLIEPNLAEAYQNLGVALDKQRKFTEALECYEKALSLKPENGMPLLNIGAIYSNSGDLKKADELYKQALPRTNYNIEVIYGVAGNLLSLSQYQELHEFIADIKDKQCLSEFHFAGLRIINAIAYAIENNYEMVERTIKEIDGLSSNEQRFPNYEGLITFFQYIDGLVKFRKENPDIFEKDSEAKLYVIGESHCLSPANTLVKLDGAQYSCVPKFIMGAQARYFSKPENNQYKAALEIVLNDVPENSKIIAMFGEIDCRLQNGILPYHKKIRKTDKQSIDATINEIIEGYVDYFISVTKNKKCEIIFYGVPASNITNGPLPIEDKELINHIIKSLNNKLSEETKHHNVRFIDTYNFTKSGSSDSASGDHHIDNYHLQPPILAQALTNTLKY